MELNPNHPVTRKVHDHWHKIAAILVSRLPKGRATITLGEIERFSATNPAITIKEVPAGLELRIVTMEEGEQLARAEGGLPV